MSLLTTLRRIRSMLPGRAVLGARARACFLAPTPPADVTYRSEPLVPFPVLPVQLFGVHYAVDLVLISTHPDWTMHELARIDLPDGPLWMAKDADRNNDQFVVADLADIERWLPEIPVRRRRSPMTIEDRSVGRRLDVSLGYRNHADAPVSIQFAGRLPGRPPWKRNGSTMGHSRGAVAVVLDLAGQTHGGSARVEIGGAAWPIERLLGLYRMQFVLEQAQGGFAVASFTQAAAPGGFRLVRPAPGVEWPTSGDALWHDDGAEVRRSGGPVTLSYRFASGSARELQGAQVEQAGREDAVLSLSLDRALPDLRRRFDGEAVSRFMLTVNGQVAHGVGELRARWEDAGPLVTMRPLAPWWLADRPMHTRVRFEGGVAVVAIARS